MGADRPLHPAALDDEALLAQCRSARSRGGGPGGQNRNKVETAVELTHQPTGISAKAGERRSVRENCPIAIRRLRYALAVGYRAGVPLGDARSEMWMARVRGGRIVCSERHRDHAAMIAEALDFLDACGWDHTLASRRLECSPSQLVKLVKGHPPAWALFQDGRDRTGRPRLR